MYPLGLILPRQGYIKILSATPTLAAGVNLPARTVVIGNYKRFMPGYGMQPIKVMEYKQMSGRAGRPQYDAEGTALLIASSDDEQEYLMKDYILGKPERIDSRLAQESALRGHTLAAGTPGLLRQHLLRVQLSHGRYQADPRKPPPVPPERGHDNLGGRQVTGN